MQLDGTVVTVTGATGGIGRALCEALAVAGARLVLSARNAVALQALSEHLPPGSVAASCCADLTDPAARMRLAEVSRTAGTSVLVNLCGSNRFALLAQHSEGDVDALLDLNLKAPIALTRLLLEHLTAQQEALVVNVGSTFGHIGFPGYSLYCACKFGLRGFSEALARELADGPVRVLHVAPRATRTGMNSPAARALNRELGNPEDAPDTVAAHIVAAIRHNRRRAAIGWRERCFAAMNQLMPALVDRALARQLATIKRFAVASQQESAT